MNSYIKDAQSIHFNVVYAFDQPKEQLNIFNDLLGSCIEKHAPLKTEKNH